MATPLDFLASLRAHQEALAAPLRAQIAGPFHHLSLTNQTMPTALSVRPFEMYYQNQDNHRPETNHHQQETNHVEQSPSQESRNNYSDDNDSGSFAPDISDRLQIDITTEDSSDVCRDEDATANVSADQEDQDDEETSSGAYENFGKFAEALSNLEQRRVTDFHFPIHQRPQQVTTPLQNQVPQESLDETTRFSETVSSSIILL